MGKKRIEKIDGFQLTTCKSEIEIKHIVTVHYFVYPKNFYFPGESHDFWEFLYVDKGVVEVQANKTLYKLDQGQIIFHEPGEFHTVSCNNQTAPNLVVVAFVAAKTPAMDFFKNKVINLTEKERKLLSTIIKEAEEAFDSQLEDPYLKGMHRRSEQIFGCEQILRNTLELLLINIFRHTPYNPERQISCIKEKTSYLRMTAIFDFLEDNVAKQLTLNEVCDAASMSRSSLQKMFKDRTGMSVIDYFHRLKIKEAKRLLQDGRYNITGIADMLGYTSIHYFSRQFSALEGMSPSEYAKSIHSEQWIENQST